MHTQTFQTRFTFGDRVRFDSPTQGCRGTGKIFAITLDEQRQVDYMIALDQGEGKGLQPGILEHEITLLGDTL